MSYVDVPSSSRHELIRLASGLSMGGGGGVPVNTVEPVLTGTPTVGQTLSCTTGTWTNSPTDYYYIWYRDEDVIPGAESSTYVLVAADAGALMWCGVIAENAAGMTLDDVYGGPLGPVAAVGGAAVLGSETNGFAADFTYATDASRVAVKTAGTVVSSGLSFFTNVGTSSKWVYNAAGTLVNVAAGSLAIDYDPVTHVCKGLLVEPVATNLLLNNATLSTQSATVTAVAHTLSFFGTGTVTLTGTSTAGPLVGTGASNRVSLTFTPTAGSLTCTVTGTVTNAQLESGSVATSLIPTLGATVTRAADHIDFLLSAIPAISTECTIYGRWQTPSPTSGRQAFCVTNSVGTPGDYAGFYVSTTANLIVANDTVSQCNVSSGGSIVANTPLSIAARVKANDFAVSKNGAAAVADTTGTMPTFTRVRFGNTGGNAAATAVFWIEKMMILPRGMSNAELAVQSAT